MLRRIFGPVKDRTTGEWRVRRNRELDEMYNDDGIVRVMQMNKARWVVM